MITSAIGPGRWCNIASTSDPLPGFQVPNGYGGDKHRSFCFSFAFWFGRKERHSITLVSRNYSVGLTAHYQNTMKARIICQPRFWSAAYLTTPLLSCPVEVTLHPAVTARPGPLQHLFTREPRK